MHIHFLGNNCIYKTIITSNISSAPLTSKEFHAVISTIQKTQKDTLVHYKSFSSPLNTMLNELKTPIDLLLFQIVVLKSKNAYLRYNLTALNNKVLDLGSNETKRSASTIQLP